MSTWRLADSLRALRRQVDTQWPHRSKDSDGTIGDERHSGRQSDHNPWIKDGKLGIVTAIDLTHDPANGFDSYAFAEHLRQTKDQRIKYVISNGRIFSSETKPWVWRHYDGTSKHDHHVHISVVSDKKHYDDPRTWSIHEVVSV